MPNRLLAAEAAAADFIDRFDARREACWIAERDGRPLGDTQFRNMHAAYDHLPAGRRQVCWAHLRRDFQAMIDRAGFVRTKVEPIMGGLVAIHSGWKV